MSAFDKLLYGIYLLSIFFLILYFFYQYNT